MEFENLENLKNRKTKKLKRTFGATNIKPTIPKFTYLAIIYVASSQRNCKEENFAWEIRQQNFSIKITASRLLMKWVYMVKKRQSETLEYYMKNGHSKGRWQFCTCFKTENFKRVILLWRCYLEYY